MESYSKEVRDAIGFPWALLVIICIFITFFWFLYCLFNWTFTWWLPAFLVITFMVAHRYGTLLGREEKRVQAEAKDRETVS